MALPPALGDLSSGGPPWTPVFTGVFGRGLGVCEASLGHGLSRSFSQKPITTHRVRHARWAPAHLGVHLRIVKQAHGVTAEAGPSDGSAVEGDASLTRCAPGDTCILRQAQDAGQVSIAFPRNRCVVVRCSTVDPCLHRGLREGNRLNWALTKISNRSSPRRRGSRASGAALDLAGAPAFAGVIGGGFNAPPPKSSRRSHRRPAGPTGPVLEAALFA